VRLIEAITKRLPWVSSSYRALRGLLTSHERVFTRAYRSTKTHGKESVSGPGSDLLQTRVVINELPRVLLELGAAVLLDIPCGDHYWMSKVNLGGVRYIGADLVGELVERNNKDHASANKQFVRLDLAADPLPKVDLVLCRDCLVHLPFNDIFKALRNVHRSGSRYLLTTTFVARTSNWDILAGEWRPLNLQRPPFSLPQPLKTVNEGCTEGSGTYSDKSLGLWSLEQLEEVLRKRR